MDERELNGWKEIANHLGKAVRTAQRWEQDLDLPRPAPKRRPSMFTRSAFVSILCVLALTLGSAVAQPRGNQRPGSTPDVQQQRPQTPQTEPGAQGAGRYEVATAKEENSSQTPHLVRLDGREIKYTATAGTLPIRLDDGKVAARMFFVAYTKDGEDRKSRPISFVYNGGPGSASAWLHMGSFAPRHVQMADEGFQPAPPYQLVDNEYSLLDITDRVSFGYYEGGHMMYIRPSAHKALKQDVATFIRSAAGGER